MPFRLPCSTADSWKNDTWVSSRSAATRRSVSGTASAGSPFGAVSSRSVASRAIASKWSSARTAARGIDRTSSAGCPCSFRSNTPNSFGGYLSFPNTSGTGAIRTVRLLVSLSRSWAVTKAAKNFFSTGFGAAAAARAMSGRASGLPAAGVSSSTTIFLAGFLGTGSSSSARPARAKTARVRAANAATRRRGV